MKNRLTNTKILSHLNVFLHSANVPKSGNSYLVVRVKAVLQSHVNNVLGVLKTFFTIIICKISVIFRSLMII